MDGRMELIGIESFINNKVVLRGTDGRMRTGIGVSEAVQST